MKEELGGTVAHVVCLIINCHDLHDLELKICLNDKVLSYIDNRDIYHGVIYYKMKLVMYPVELYNFTYNVLCSSSC